jgi:proliferating cell nuclear antigen PCNA
MKLVLDEAKLLKKSMEIISDIVLEGTFVFKKDYVELVALNSNNVVMVIFRMLKQNFSTYEVEEDSHISLSLEHFSEVLKSCEDGAPLILEQKDSSTLSIISQGKNTKEFSLSLIEFNDENIQKIPNLEFPVKVVSSSSNFTQAINDLSFIEEGISFIVSENSFSLKGKTNSMSGNIELKENISVENSVGKTVECRYSMEYLKKFIKTDKLVNTVELSMNEDYPLKVEYKLMDKLLLGFILAPRGEE